VTLDTFRHNYRAWLDETRAPMGVQQKLMRQAPISTTMDQYGNASALAKRKTNRPIVQRVLRREMNQQVSIQQLRGTVGKFPSLDSFGQSLQMPNCL
jgi:integrase